MIILNEGSLFADHYRLTKRLGAGSFGEVWLARNLLADLDVAIKIYSLVDEKGIQDFRDEFKIAYKLNHPNLLHLNHFDVYNQRPFLVMPYCMNGATACLIGRMSERDIWCFIRDVSNGLMFLHAQIPPIIHQDIKPGNILIGDDGRYMISDFGISRQLGRTLHKGAGMNMSSGTLAYMGPERFSSTPLVVATSDIWSLGMSVVELLTGKVFWEGMGGCVQLNGAGFPSLSGRCSQELEDFICQCLSLNTWDRPTAQQAYEVACRMLQSSSRQSHAPARSSSSVISSVSFNKKQVSSFNKPLALSSYWKTYRMMIVGGVVGIFAVAALLIGIRVYVNSVEEQNALFKCTTLTDCYQFLRDYPSSSYKEQLQEKITRLKRDSIYRAKKVQEKAIWTNQKDTIRKDEREIDAMIPEKTIYVGRTLPKVDQTDLQKPVSDSPEVINARKERAFFERCRTVMDYQRYLRIYPKGRFIHDAKKAIREIETSKMNSRPKNLMRLR